MHIKSVHSFKITGVILQKYFYLTGVGISCQFLLHLLAVPHDWLFYIWSGLATYIVIVGALKFLVDIKGFENADLSIANAVYMVLPYLMLQQFNAVVCFYTAVLAFVLAAFYTFIDEE